MDLLLLGNSGVSMGHALVGIDLESGEWIRLMTKHQDGHFLIDETGTELAFLGFRSLRTLDVLQVTLGERCPDLGYAECVYFETMKYKGTWNLHDNLAQLDKYVDRTWLEPSTRSSWLIKVDSPEFYVSLHDTYAEARSRFKHNGVDYDVRVSDHAPWIKNARDQRSKTVAYPQNRTWYFTVCLAKPGRGDLVRIVSALLT